MHTNGVFNIKLEAFGYFILSLHIKLVNNKQAIREAPCNYNVRKRSFPLIIHY